MVLPLRDSSQIAEGGDIKDAVSYYAIAESWIEVGPSRQNMGWASRQKCDGFV